MVIKVIVFILLEFGECNDRMVHAWEYIGPQRKDYPLYCADEEK